MVCRTAFYPLAGAPVILAQHRLQSKENAMTLLRRRILQWAAAAIGMAAVDPAIAQTSYPERAVHLVVGFTAGSATDITARMFADKLSQLWSVPVVVENVPG